MKSKEDAERVRLEAELELEKQRSISEEAQKTRELELEVIRLEVEAKALEKEAHDPDNLQERLKAKDEETIPASHNQENDEEIKPDEVPENIMTSDVAYMSTSTPKPGTKHQQLKVKFQDKEEASNVYIGNVRRSTVKIREHMWAVTTVTIFAPNKINVKR